MKNILVPIAVLFFMSTPTFAMDGNVLWLPFENNVLDSSDFGNDGNLYNGTFVTGVFGQGFHVDASNYEMVYVNDSESLDFGTGNISIEFWINPDDCEGGLFTKGVAQLANMTPPYNQPETDINEGFLTDEMTDYGGECQINFGLAPLGDAFYPEKILIPAQQWTHVVIAREGNVWKFYKNGTLNVSNDVGENANLSTSLPLPFIIGTYTDAGVTPNDIPAFYDRAFWDNWAVFTSSSFDEFRLWNRALSETEIANLVIYNDVSVPPAPPDETVSMFAPLVMLLIGVGLFLFVFRQFREGELSVNKLIGIVLTIVIAMGFIAVISGMV